MITVSKSLNGAVIVIPIVIGAFLSGVVYLAEGASIPLTIFQMTLVIGFLVFGLKQLANQDLSLSFYGLEKEYLLFLSIIFLSLVYSPEREQGLFYALRYIILITMTYLIYNSIESYKDLKIICYAMVGIALVLASINIIQLYLNPEVAAFNYINEGKKLIRSRGVEQDPNIFASNFFMPIMFLIAFLGEAKTLQKRLALFFLVGILIASVLLTYSRSAWVSIFFGALIIVFFQRKLTFLIYSLAAFAVVFSISEGVRSIIFSVGERILDIFAGSSDDSSKFRIVLFKTAILMWLDSYTFGIGYQGFSTVFKQYHPPQETAWIYEPHSEFYAVLSELGLIGFLVFLFMLWKILRIGWNTVKRRKINKLNPSIPLALFSSFVSYLIFFQFLGGMQLHSILMINIGLLFAASKFINSPNSRRKLKPY